MTFRRFAWIGFVACSGVLTVAACSGGSDSNGAATSDSFASQYCQLFSQCCAKVNRPTDGSQCRVFVTAAASGKTYDAAKGTQCLNELSAASQKPEFCDGIETPPSCDDVYKSAGGAKEPGEACEQDSDCKAPAEGEANCETHFSNDAQTRTCQVQIPGKVGDTPCLGTKDGNSTFYQYSSTPGPDGGTAGPPSQGYICDVADGLRCDSTTKACATIPAEGAPCQPYQNYGCVKTAYCDGNTKTCVPRIAAGGDCSGVSGNDACADGLGCDQTTKKCTALLADGQPCKASSECEASACVNGKCGSSSGDDLGYALLCGGN